MNNVMCAVVVLFTVPAFAADQPALHVLATQGVKFDYTKTGTTKPVEIKSADELAKSTVFADDASRDAIKKRIDFATEKFVVFAWGGSGGDKRVGALSKDGKIAEFTFTGGVTLDLAHHAYVFIVPKDAKVDVKK